MSETHDEQSASEAAEDGTERMRREAREIFGSQTYNVSFGEIRGSTLNFGIQTGDSKEKTDVRDPLVEGVLENRNNFMSAFLQSALLEARVTFYLSILFLAIGASLILIAAIVGTARFWSGDSIVVSVVPGAIGVVLSGMGGVLASRADKARNHAAEQANLVGAHWNAETQLAQAVLIAEAIDDDALRNNVRAEIARGLVAPRITEQIEAKPIIDGEVSSS
ncbi:TRADD-N-associated membrane domain-containing protein [Cryptosporangium japonicum]|uniref:Cyanobacterial TRADD-N associated 2 transmembrane domain-containing protein n=1 Tax=Cryptosporangium japonicum TaxID=80872 RepID=A0ABP3EYC1_9ACTN